MGQYPGELFVSQQSQQHRLVLRTYSLLFPHQFPRSSYVLVESYAHNVPAGNTCNLLTVVQYLVLAPPKLRAQVLSQALGTRRFHISFLPPDHIFAAIPVLASAATHPRSFCGAVSCPAPALRQQQCSSPPHSQFSSPPPTVAEKCSSFPGGQCSQPRA